MLLQIVLVCTPLTEKLFLSLTVAEPAAKADIIVCLGGDRSRLIRAARLYHRGLAPRMLVSNAPGAAEDMRNILVMMGVPKDRILMDNTSYVTVDHPAGLTRLLGDNAKQQQLLIVTDHPHTRRAAACFRRAGFERFTLYDGRPPWPVEYQNAWRWRFKVLPSLAYEYVALVQYWLQGRI